MHQGFQFWFETSVVNHGAWVGKIQTGRYQGLLVKHYWKGFRSS